MGWLDRLLDDRLIEGVYPVTRELSPEHYAAAVDRDLVGDAIDAVERLCQHWGGACSGLVSVHDPLSSGAGDLEEPWIAFIRSAHFDHLATREVLAGQQLHEHLGAEISRALAGESILAVLAAASARGQRPGDWAPVHVALPDPDDPWYLAYLGCLGSLPEDPDPDLLDRARLRPDLAWGELVEVTREAEIEAPSGSDLIRRMRGPGWTPCTLSVFGLVPYGARRPADLASKPSLLDEHWDRLSVGPNIVVVYEPDSVADLCLLWNLRAAHGLHDGLPLAIPSTADVEATLRVWSDPDGEDIDFAPQMRGLPERPWALVSLSVGAEQLEQWAQAAPGPWRVMEARDLLQPIKRPARRSSDIAVFEAGQARVAAWGPGDREFLRGRPRSAFGRDLRARISLTDRPLPPIRRLSGRLPFIETWKGGGYERQANEPDAVMRVEWPSGWTVLRAAVQERGLDIRPSRPGRAAAALLEQLGAFREIDPLLDDQVIAQLLRLGERAGISWFRGEVRRLQGRLADESEEAGKRSELIEEHLQALSLRPFDEEQHELVFSRLKDVLSAPAARAWLTWAEDRGLIVRGAGVKCGRCGATGWRPSGELAPPITCGGCGKVIAQPFPVDAMPFRYRAAQALLEVLAADALPHLFAAHWWAALLERGWLYGLYPGVEFLDGKRVAREVDLVLLFADGQLGLGECKQRPVKLSSQEVQKLEDLADRLDARITCYCVPAWAEQARGPWRNLRREEPKRRSFALTAEHLLQDYREILPRLGVDWTAWQEADAAERAERHQRFVQRLPSTIASLNERFSLAHEVVAGDQPPS
jgi:hypothetical protein